MDFVIGIKLLNRMIGHEIRIGITQLLDPLIQHIRFLLQLCRHFRASPLSSYSKAEEYGAKDDESSTRNTNADSGFIRRRQPGLMGNVVSISSTGTDTDTLRRYQGRSNAGGRQQRRRRRREPL